MARIRASTARRPPDPSVDARRATTHRRQNSPGNRPSRTGRHTPMRSLPEAKALLARLYGLEFPDSLFLLHEFFSGLPVDERPDRFSGLGMEPIGPLQVLSRSDAELERIKPALPWALHWRFFRDVPEFF